MENTLLLGSSICPVLSLFCSHTFCSAGKRHHALNNQYFIEHGEGLFVTEMRDQKVREKG
ncbi:hypothetical protein [Thiocystis violacea]|uniref:hypothetical protein n=1 Tax=Thiocystis violacea TaxID=13725 RepID=UPI001904DAE6|nr:hypothetical protein [Thiocystis violacea]